MNSIINKTPKHIAIILDGNGRWAEENGHTRNYGHRKGCDALVSIVKHSRKLSVKYLSVFAFSTENWKRPKKEVDYLLNLINLYLNRYINDLVNNGVCVKIIGSRENLSMNLIKLIEDVESRTKNNTNLYFNICFNYGSHDEIVTAVKKICVDVLNDNIMIDDISQAMFEKYLFTYGIPPVDLLIRTSGEQRISNFLLWQIAYSELYFTKVYWPDFSKNDLEEAINNYKERNRRFGGLK